MKRDITLMDCARLFAQMQQLCEQSRQVCEETALLCLQSRQQHVKSPWPHPVSLVAPLDDAYLLPGQSMARLNNDVLESHEQSSIHNPATTRDEGRISEEGAVTDQEILELMIAVLGRLPLAQQIQIVKTLCLRTVATTKAHLHTTTAMSA